MPPAAQQALQWTAERGGETAAVASWSPGPGRRAAFTSAAAERPVRWAAEGDRDLITGENILQTLAEVSIAFTGFSGVVGVFGGRPVPKVGRPETRTIPKD